MKFAQIAIALAVAFSLTVGSAGVAMAGGDKAPEKPKDKGKKKVKVCHIPPGNPGNAHIITIPKKAFKKGHAKHGAKVKTKYGPKFVTDFIVKSKHDAKKCKNLKGVKKKKGKKKKHKKGKKKHKKY